MIRRNGVTLVEVLVAIFVMGIGMLALLTLFPLGALTMAQAIKDDRAGNAVANAAAIAKHWKLKTNAAYLPVGYPAPPAVGGLPALPAIAAGQGYPVYIDPIGQYTFTATPATPTTLANVPTGIRRYVPTLPGPPPTFGSMPNSIR